MAGTKEIKRRIKSVKNTKKITKAMELVAASKMKRAVERAVSSRPYYEHSISVLKSISNSVESKLNFHHLFSEQIENDSILIIVVSSNRGLCGAYNAQIARSVVSFLKNNPDKKIDFITVGKKGDALIRKLGKNIIASFLDLPENISFSNILPIIKMSTDLFTNKEYGSVLIASTNFVSALYQKAEIRQVLPIRKEDVFSNKDIDTPNTKGDSIDYLFEPEYDKIVNFMVDKLSKAQIFHLFLESIASEQSSRMIAMKNASDAAGDMINDLTLVFNKARQSNITKEISEISAGMASVN